MSPWPVLLGEDDASMSTEILLMTLAETVPQSRQIGWAAWVEPGFCQAGKEQAFDIIRNNLNTECNWVGPDVA